MNTQQLSCFVSVYEKLSFTKAAEELFLSVPTVAHHIKSLEFELNTTLFIRDNHSVTITKDGEAFYDEARQILRIENNFKDKHKRNTKDEIIKIVCTSYSELNLISLILKDLKLDINNLRPEIYVRPYSEALHMLKNNIVDVMLGSNNMIINETVLSLNASINQSTYIILNKDDPLANKETISFKDLENKTIIRFNEKLVPFHSKNRIKDLLNIHSGRNNDYVCDDENICLSLLDAEFGVALIPEYRIPKYISKNLLIKNIKENELFKYGIIILKDKNNNTLNKFIEYFNLRIQTYKFNSKI